MAEPNGRCGELFWGGRGRGCVLACLLAALSVCPPAFGGAPAEQATNPFGETIRVLEQWTMSH